MVKKWYYKKRFLLLLFLLVGLWIGSRLEALKMRYHPIELSKAITTSTNLPFVFKQKEVDGRTMQYSQLGNDMQLPLVVFVHGSPGALSAYEDYLKDSLLYKKATLISVDRLGFGYSEFGTAVPSLDIQAKLIASILEDFPNTKKILIGHSMGGPVNCRLAMNYPHLVDGMVLVAPSISPALEPSNWWRHILDFPLFRWFTPPALRVCNQEIIPLKKKLQAIEGDWTNITCPVTIIHGTEDPLVPVGNAFFAQKQLVNSSSVVIEIVQGGNHFILWSELPLIREAILEMLKQVSVSIN